MIANNFCSQENVVKFQINLMKLQLGLEESFIEIGANSKEPTVILTDRGLMDGAAYMTSEGWQALLDETGWTNVQLRDSRYEVVIHMVSAAQGAEEFYDNVTNESRYEV
jgi:hypothetical protein